MEWVEAQRIAHPAKAEHYAKLQDLQRRKLWHQLTEALEEFVKLPVETGEDLLQLYYSFVKDFESKLNAIKFVQIMTSLSKQYTDLEAAAGFFNSLAEKVAGDREALTLCKMELASVRIRQDKVQEAKQIIDDCKATLDAIHGADPVVQSCFYRIAADYYKRQGPPAEFYKHALCFLSFTPPDELAAQQRIVLASDLALAALVADTVYNLGELIAHPVFACLDGTDFAWLSHLVHVFNAGNIPEYERLTVAYHAYLNAQAALVANAQSLKQKITILALMELIFTRAADDRSIPFEVIASATQLPIHEVEFLVMKALSLGLVRGHIDQVLQVVRVSWVQPRVLDINQVARLKERLEGWSANIRNTIVYVEGQTPDLLT